MIIKRNDIKRVAEYVGMACGPCSLVKIYELKSGGCFLTDGQYWSKTDRNVDQVLEDFSNPDEKNQVAMENSYISIDEGVTFE